MNPRLILLIDFSQYSEAVLKLADAWGQNLNAQLLLVHQVTPVVPGMANAETKKELLEAEKANALQRLRKLAAHCISAPLATEFLVTECNLISTVQELTQQPYRNSVLLGLKGAGLFRKFFIGSTASSILEDVNVLTIAVPADLNAWLPEKVIVALHPATPHNKPELLFWLQKFRSEIKQLEFISVNETGETDPEKEAYLSQIAETYQAGFPATYKLFTGHDAAGSIKMYMQTAGEGAFLVVQKGPRSVSDKLFRNFLIDELLNECPFPLIILPE